MQKELGRNARSYVKENYTLEDLLAIYEDTLIDLLCDDAGEQE